MAIRRVIYATILAAVYLAASLLSLLSICLCDHPHHTHLHDHAEAIATHCDHSCCNDCEADGLSFEDDGCNHHHTLLESNTILITQKQRGNIRLTRLPTLVLAALSPVEENLLQDISFGRASYCYGDEPWPLRAAFISCKSLRAPPVHA